VTLAWLVACQVPGGTTPASSPDSPPCASGQILDGASCVPESCGVGTWGSIEVDEATAFVDASVGPGGDGTAAAPFDTVTKGADEAGARGGGLVALAAGTYMENLVLGEQHDGVRIDGRCAEMVTLDGSAGDVESATLRLEGRRGTEVEVSGVTVMGGRYGGAWVASGRLALRDSNAVRNVPIGVLAYGEESQVDLDGVLILETQPDESGLFGRGIDVEDGARLSATLSTVQGNHDVGVYAYGDGTDLDLTDTLVLDTASSPDGTLGLGIQVRAGASLAATGCMLQGNRTIGVYSTDGGTTVVLADTTVLDTESSSNGTMGIGIVAQDGASLAATGCTVRGNREAGVFANGDGAAIALTDTLVLDTRLAPDGTFGFGIAVENGASLVATGCTVQGNHDAGVFASDDPTTVALTDTSVLDTGTLADGMFGRGISVQTGASLTATRCTVQGNHDIGVLAASDGTTVELTDTAVLDTASSPDGTGGRGIGAQNRASLAATRCTVRGNHDIGVFVSDDGTIVDLTDVLVDGTRRGPSTSSATGLHVQISGTVRATGLSVMHTEGPGLYVVSGGNLHCSDCAISENSFAGVVVEDRGNVSMTSSTIRENVSDSGEGGGIGIFAWDYLGAPVVVLDRTVVGPHPLAAVWLDGAGSYQLIGSEFHGSAPVVLENGIPVHGDAVVALNGVGAWDDSRTTGLLLSSSTVADAQGAGLLLHGSTATLDGNVWTANATDLVQQNCDDAPSWPAEGWEEAPVAEICAGTDRLIFPVAYNLHLEDAAVESGQ